MGIYMPRISIMLLYVSLHYCRIIIGKKVSVFTFPCFDVHMPFPCSQSHVSCSFSRSHYTDKSLSVTIEGDITEATMFQSNGPAELSGKNSPLSVRTASHGHFFDFFL